MACAPPPPIGTMLCSKEPPPAQPAPTPNEGCFQFETDYAGNVGNDMGVPTVGYRAGRFNLPEWHEATYAKYYQSFADRDNAERLRNVSTDMIKETNALARLSQVSVYAYISITPYTAATHTHIHIQCTYSVSRKKRDQNVFGNISDKPRAILMKFDTRFPE